jgi:zinc protease
MKSLDVSQKNLDNQRAVVKEEYRMRIENRPYVPAEIRLEEMIFEGYYPYEHSTIGSLRDLDAAQLDWVRSFHDAYYAPNLAVLSIAGDFDPDEAMALVRRYFGDAKPQPSPRPYRPGDPPPQAAPRDAVIVDAHAKLPAILYGWPIPHARDKDHYALELAAMLLADGESSLLYRALVREQALAVEVGMEAEGHRGPDAMELEVKLAGTAPVAKVEKLVARTLADVARLGASDAQMAKLRARIQHEFLFGLESNFARAEVLSRDELFWGDASLVNTELASYLAVTSDDIKRVVAKYLVPEHRSRIEVKPGVEEKKP